MDKWDPLATQKLNESTTLKSVTNFQTMLSELPDQKTFSFLTNMNISQTFNGPCDSNSTLWLMTSPICSTKFESFVSFLIVALVLTIITLGTIFGNILVLLALYRFKKLRSMSNCLIGNLAVSDLLLALSVLPVSTGYDLLGYWVFGEITCTIWLCIDVLYCTASIWGLCTIAVDRYTATVYPVWYHERRSPTRALVYIIFVWLFSIIVSVAPFIGWRDMIPSFYQYNLDIKRYECVLFATKSYVVYSAMGSFVIPTFLMVFLYVRIFIVLKKRSRLMQPRQKRVLYPTESDFESEAHFDERDSDEKQDVELKAVATQTTPINKKHSKSGSIENGDASKTMNGKNNSQSNITPLLDNKNKPDIIRHTKTGPIHSRPSLTVEITDTCSTIQTSISSPDINKAPYTNGEVQKSSLTVNQSPFRTPRSPGSRKSVNIAADECSEIEIDHRFMKKRKSKSLFTWTPRLMKAAMGHGSIKQKYEMREQRATKRMAMIMACFCFCWWPFVFMYTIRSFCESCDINTHFQASIIWLGYANSSLNPILYTIFNDDFRKAFKRIIFCRKRGRRRHRVR